jgi:hypothetical protein
MALSRFESLLKLLHTEMSMWYCDDTDRIFCCGALQRPVSSANFDPFVSLSHGSVTLKSHDGFIDLR